MNALLVLVISFKWDHQCQYLWLHSNFLLGSRNGEHAHTVFAELPAGPHSDRKGIMKPLAPKERVTCSQAAPGFRARSQRTGALLSQQGENDARSPRASNRQGWIGELSGPPFASLFNDVWFDLFSFSWTICAKQGWPALFQHTFIFQAAFAKAPSSHLLAMIHSHTFTLRPIVDRGHKCSEGIPAWRETGFVQGSSIIQQWSWMTEASWNSLHFWMKKLQQPLTGRLKKETLLSLIIFSCLRDGGWEFFLVVSDAVLKHLPFIKEELCCGYTDYPVVVNIYENHFRSAVKTKVFCFLYQTTWEQIFLFIEIHCIALAKWHLRLRLETAPFFWSPLCR